MFSVIQSITYNKFIRNFLPTYLASISALRRFGLSSNVTISSELTLRDCNNSVIDFNVVPVSKISSMIRTSLFSIDEPKSLRFELHQLIQFRHDSLKHP